MTSTDLLVKDLYNKPPTYVSMREYFALLDGHEIEVNGKLLGPKDGPFVMSPRITFTQRGGPGSGHFDHAGRPGEVGGSAPAGTVPAGSASEGARRVGQTRKIYSPGSGIKEMAFSELDLKFAGESNLDHRLALEEDLFRKTYSDPRELMEGIKEYAQVLGLYFEAARGDLNGGWLHGVRSAYLSLTDVVEEYESGELDLDAFSKDFASHYATTLNILLTRGDEKYGLPPFGENEKLQRAIEEAGASDAWETLGDYVVEYQGLAQKVSQTRTLLEYADVVEASTDAYGQFRDERGSDVGAFRERILDGMGQEIDDIRRTLEESSAASDNHRDVLRNYIDAREQLYTAENSGVEGESLRELQERSDVLDQARIDSMRQFDEAYDAHNEALRAANLAIVREVRQGDDRPANFGLLIPPSEILDRGEGEGQGDAIRQQAMEAEEYLRGLISPDIEFDFGAGVTRDDDGRADYMRFMGKGLISINPGERAEVVVHEFGHYMEDANEGIANLARGFLLSRVGEERAQKLSEITSKAYGDEEIAVPDDFGTAYTGKIYSGLRATEITSMGLQKLYRDGPKFLVEEPEYAELILYIVSGGKVGEVPR